MTLTIYQQNVLPTMQFTFECYSKLLEFYVQFLICILWAVMCYAMLVEFIYYWKHRLGGIKEHFIESKCL